MADSRMSAAMSHDESFSAAQELEYQRLRAEIVELVNELHLHNNRIEALVDQLYGINRRIMSIDFMRYLEISPRVRAVTGLLPRGSPRHR